MIENITNKGKSKIGIASKKVLITTVVAIAVVIIVCIIVGVVVVKNSTTQDKAVKTEVGTTADGEVVVMQGTDPNGVIIENGTHPDGTLVEVATESNGELATSADGSYVINYPSDNANSESDSSKSENKNTSSKNNSSSKNESKTDSSSSKTGNSSSSTSKTENSSSSNSSSKTENNNSSNSTTNSSSNETQQNGSSVAVVNGTEYKVGDKIRVSYYLQSSVKFSGVYADINYDGTVIKIDNESLNMPNLTGAMGNPDLENKVTFTAVSARAVNDFTSEKLLVSCDFVVQKTSQSSDVTINIIELLDDNVANISSENYTVTTKIEKI